MAPLDMPILHSRHTKKQITFDKKDYAEIYKGIKNAYLDGNVISKQRDYYFIERQAITRYNITNFYNKIEQSPKVIHEGFKSKVML